MRPNYLVASIVVVASLSADARAEWASDWVTGCKAELPVQPTYDDVSWSGACRNGLATGRGTLRGTNATRIEGEFDEGRPITATGQYVLTHDSARELVRVSYRNGLATVEPPADRPGRKRIDIKPLVGSWEWRLQDGKCAHTREYLATGESVVRQDGTPSSQLVRLYSIDGKPGWMEMEGTTVGRSGIWDCASKSSFRDGDTERLYLRIDNNGNFSGCTTLDEKSCIHTVVRAGTATEPEPPSTERHLITSQAGRATGGINTANMTRGFGSNAQVGAGGTNDNSRMEIELVFDRNKGALYALYGRALRDHPTLEGKVEFELDIDVTGVVTDCRIKTSELNAPGLEARLCTRIRLMRFGPKAAPVSIVKPIDFFPAA